MDNILENLEKNTPFSQIIRDENLDELLRTVPPQRACEILRCLDCRLKYDSKFYDVTIQKNPAKRATTYLWGDGSVTVVKSRTGDQLDDYATYCVAVATRIIGPRWMVNSIIADADVFEKSHNHK